VASEPLAISQSTAWGAGGGILAGIFPLIEERRIPQSERVTKDRLRFFVSLVLLPSVGVFIAVLDRSKCSEIDAATSVFVGFAASSLLQKWGSDSFNF
jgi:flagellar biosynthesis protein FliR